MISTWMGHLLSSVASVALSLVFTNGAALDSRITFSRPSLATHFDSTGKLTYAPNNLQLRSQTFDSATWAKANATVSANAVTAPDGTLTADTITATATAFTAVQQSTTLTGGQHISSVYAKAGTATVLQIVDDHMNGGSTNFCNFDLTNGVVGTSNGHGGTIQSVGNGWYRCSVIFLAAAATRLTYLIPVASASAARASTVTAGATIHIWGAQLEAVTYETSPRTYNATVASAYHGPRFDYDPATLTALGLLVEESRSNLFVQSQDASTSWNGSNFSRSLVSNPLSGVTDLQRLTTTAATSSTRIFQAPTGGGTQTLSFVAKAGTLGFVHVRWDDGATIYGRCFNLSTGAITAGFYDGALTTTVPTDAATATSLGNGFYRCTMTAPRAGASNLFLYFAESASTTAVAVGRTIDFYYAQLETGTFATSYIPTKTATVTRSVDSAVMTGTNFSDWYNQNEGTFVADYRSYADSYYGVASANNGTSNERVDLRVNGITYVTDGGVAQFEPAIVSPAAGAFHKLGVAYKLNDFARSLDGVNLATDAAGTLPTPTQLQIGNIDGTTTFPLNGHIRSLAYYNTRKSNAELQALTT